MTKKTVVFYHSNCPDGFSSAWIFRKKFGSRAQYIAFNYHQNIDPKIINSDIYFVDISPKEDMIQQLSLNNRVILIDHHLSSQNKLQLFTEVIFDMNHSGAVLSWHYLFPNKEVPLLFKYVEDIDLWKFALPHSHELNSFIDINELTFTNWDKLIKLFNNKKKLEELIIIGKNIVQYQDKLIKDIASKAELIEFEKEKVLAVNTPVLISEVGNYLIKQKGPFSVIWHKAAKKILVSLRADGKYDVSKLAEKYGGGGHKNAAGFVIEDIKQIPWHNF